MGTQLNIGGLGPRMTVGEVVALPRPFTPELEPDATTTGRIRQLVQQGARRAGVVVSVSVRGQVILVTRTA